MNTKDLIYCSVGVVVERRDVFEGCSVAELVLIFRLNHSRPLCPQSSYCLEQIRNAFVL